MELFLLLFLQLFQFSQFLFPEVVFVVEPLILVVAVDNLGGGGRHNHPVDLKLSSSFSSFLLQIHLLYVVPCQRSLPFDSSSYNVLFFFLKFKLHSVLSDLEICSHLGVYPFGLLLKPFGGGYFDLATFWTTLKKNCLNWFCSMIFRALM